MNEPYYEDQKPADGRPYYPFHCHLQSYLETPLMCAAHWHYAIEILYATRGSATVFLNGQAYTFKKGDMILINARDVHAIWGEPKTQYVCIKFDPEILYTASRSIFESRYVLPFTMAKESPQKLFPEEEIGDTPLPGLIVEALREFAAQAYGFDLAVRTNICRIFLWVLRSWQSKGLKAEPGYSLKEKDMERLQAVFDCLDQRYMQNLTAEAMARQCNMSYSYFSRYFKSAIGKSFTAYLNYVRITEAEKLLLSTDKTVTEIAMETGFSSASYFISQFRLLKKVSPRQYRQKLALT
ncbi:MAG: AraC family transcriptional regulator [Clostridiaceae bacterium]|nr:AraC family transcriptional regulator [Clostridiaceae bacterium]